MLSSLASFCADGVCMHLTSEHARERALAAERVSDMLGRKDDLRSLPIGALERLVKGYLQMLTVELHNACRGRGPPCHMQPATEGKLRRILCDARALWSRAMAALRSSRIIAGAIKEALPSLVEALAVDDLAPISSDLLALVSLLTANDAATALVSQKIVRALYAFCRQARVHGRPALTIRRIRASRHPR
jgi:hypothetical protein